MTNAPSRPAALDGIRVLDLSRVLAGPWSTQILADLGADVLKIEQPGKGDDTRGWGPPYLKDEAGADVRPLSAYYLSANRNKRSVAVDIASAEGQALIRRLAEKADIVVENFKVGGLARYGLDYPALAALNPRLVYCSITGFGQTGPYASQPGYDYLGQGMGGLMSITGEPDGEPLKVGVAICDLSTGMYATVAILAALRHAERTGEGQHIDVSLLDTQIAMLGNQALSWLVGGACPERMGNRHPTVVPYRTFEAVDGTIIIAVGNDGQFARLAQVLDAPEWAEDARFAQASARVVHRDAIEAEVQARVAGWPGATLIERLLAAGVPAGRVNTIAEVFADPFVEARETVRFFQREGTAPVPSVAFPAKLSATPARYDLPPPLVGEHTDSAVADWLED